VGGQVREDHDSEFVQFVRTSGAALARTAVLLTGDPALGEDLLQTALALTFVRWRSSPDIVELEAYVRRVLVTANASWRRRRTNSELPTATPLYEQLDDDIAPDLVERQRVLQALQRLPHQQRAVLVLRYFDDLSEADTAKALGCSPGSVKTHTSRGLARLRSLLSQDGAVSSPA
jgi:RNA polymerase sigma-70 factor (sigma-E family)